MTSDLVPRSKFELSFWPGLRPKQNIDLSHDFWKLIWFTTVMREDIWLYPWRESLKTILSNRKAYKYKQLSCPRLNHKQTQDKTSTVLNITVFINEFRVFWKLLCKTCINGDFFSSDLSKINRLSYKNYLPTEDCVSIVVFFSIVLFRYIPFISFTLLLINTKSSTANYDQAGRSLHREEIWCN